MHGIWHHWGRAAWDRTRASSQRVFNKGTKDHTIFWRHEPMPVKFSLTALNINIECSNDDNFQTVQARIMPVLLSVIVLLQTNPDPPFLLWAFS